MFPKRTFYIFISNIKTKQNMERLFVITVREQSAPPCKAKFIENDNRLPYGLTDRKEAAQAYTHKETVNVIRDAKSLLTGHVINAVLK